MSLSIGKTNFARTGKIRKIMFDYLRISKKSVNLQTVFIVGLMIVEFQEDYLRELFEKV